MVMPHERSIEALGARVTGSLDDHRRSARLGSQRVTELQGTLHELLGERCLLDPATTEQFERDWTGSYQGSARAVVLPESAEEVARILQIARACGVDVVPQGGNTGLVGGAVPYNGAIVLRTTRLDEVRVDTDRGHLVAGAGVTVEAASRAAAAHDLMLPFDLGSRAQATLGGLIATNAGGLRAHRYGRAGQWLRGATLVLADGVVVDRLSPPAKESAGFELFPLLPGSEGTLAVLTHVRVQLVPRQARRLGLLLGGSDLDALIAQVAGLEQVHGPADCVEGWFGDGLAACLTRGLDRYPLTARHDCHLLAEWSGDDDGVERLLGGLEEALHPATDVAVADDDAALRRLWAARELHPLLASGDGRPVLKVDTAVPASDRLPGLRTAVRRAVLGADPTALVVLFGHVMDGNLHVNVATDHRDAVLAAVCETTLDLGGTVSAEHGIGRLKLPWVTRLRAPSELAVLQSLKRTLDPDGLLNPGVLLPVPTT